MSIQLFQHLPDQIRHLLYITQQTAGSDLADLISYMLQFVASTVSITYAFEGNIQVVLDLVDIF